MNIKNNRFVLFLAPFVWCAVAMSTTRSISSLLVTVWFLAGSLLDCIEITHRKFINYEPDTIQKMRSISLKQTAFTCLCASVGMPAVSVISFVMYRVEASPHKISFICGMAWLMSNILNIFWPIKIRFYGVLILLLSLATYGMRAELEGLGTKSSHQIKRYTTIWIFRFCEQMLVSSLRYFVWCDHVFPYVIRWDLFVLGIVTTFIIMYVINSKKPNKLLKFSSNMEHHLPAPDFETALECTICKKAIVAIDVEHGVDERSGFTLYEDDKEHTL